MADRLVVVTVAHLGRVPSLRSFVAEALDVARVAHLYTLLLKIVVVAPLPDCSLLKARTRVVIWEFVTGDVRELSQELE